MKTNQKIIIIFKFFISFILATCVLSVFIYFYRHSMGKVNEYQTTDDKWYPNQFCSNMEEGFAWIRFDENGFNNSYPKKKENIDILLIGSSHLEAIQMKSEENICYLLNNYFLDYYSYSIGMSGHFLPTNINNLTNAYNYYKPQKCLAIECGIIKLKSNELKSVLNGTFKRRIPNDKGINYYIKNYTPLFKTLGQKIVGQINLWEEKSYASILNKNNTKETIKLDEKEETVYCKVLNNFLAFARKSVPDEIPLIIFYHPSYTLQPDGSIKNNTDKWYQEIFAKACKNNNIIFIDTDNDLQELYKTRHILPYGFINTAVGTGHLNKYGHEVIAKRLAKEIMKLEGEKNGSK